MADVSVTILRYEDELELRVPDIERLLGVGRIHLDVMRPDFIEQTTRFASERLAFAIALLADRARLDIHLMADEPASIVAHIAELVPHGRRGLCTVFVHREACRGGGAHSHRSFDRSRPSTGDGALDAQLRAADAQSVARLKAALSEIKDAGFRAGLALEESTDVAALAPFAPMLDAVLVMSILSGAGGRTFLESTPARIAALKRAHPRLELQVDGGINPETGRRSVAAGADVLAVGSFVTAAEDVGAALDALRG